MECLECGGTIVLDERSGICTKCGTKDAIIYKDWEAREGLRTFTRAIVELDPHIRWTAILDKSYEMQASRMKEGTSPLVTDQDLSVTLPMLSLAIRLEEFFGPMHYTLAKHDHLTLAFFADSEASIMVTLENCANLSEILETVRNYLLKNRSYGRSN